MNLEQYSTLLSVVLVFLSLATIISIFGFIFSQKIREKLQSLDYFLYIKLIGLLSIIATISVLVYQFVYKTPVCEYCWWQRIFMFPIDFIVIGSLFNRIKKNEYVIAVLAIIGGTFAAVHYYFHYQVAVLENLLVLPCSSVGLIPSCTENSILIWGFITIPLMALVVFISIVWVAYLAWYSEKK